MPPTVNVSVFYPGASAETIAGTVLAPLEVNINGVENMLYMTSTASSGSGSGSINVYFSLGTDPDMALVNVNNKVNLAQTTLPETVRLQGVQVTKRSPAMLQVIALYSPDGRYDAVYLHNYMQMNVADELKRVPGVGDVTVFGYMDYAMRIWLVPDKLAKYGVTVSEIAAAIQEQNSQFSPGRLGDAPMPDTAQLSWQIDTKGRLATPQEFGEIIIRTGEDSAMLRPSRTWPASRWAARTTASAANTTAWWPVPWVSTCCPAPTPSPPARPSPPACRSWPRTSPRASTTRSSWTPTTSLWSPSTKWSTPWWKP